MIRIAAVGDVHFGEDSGGTLRPHLERLPERADVLLIAGDLTRIGTIAEARVLVEELDGVGVPTIAVLGNHDHHSDQAPQIRALLEDAGIRVLEQEATTVPVNGACLAVVGAKGFGGGFSGSSGTAFGEPEMKQFIRATEAAAAGLESALRDCAADARVVLLHYSPVKETLHGEAPEIYPFLGSFLLARAVDTAGADLVIHGHAHGGAEKGVTPGGVRVRNVAEPVIRESYRVYVLDR